ncbi:MAG: hypothetical protein VKO39_09245 [Cyanobacteriota bacterium]|nr:hypothetical protein [Cyanobacteriota bacterium]
MLRSFLLSIAGGVASLAGLAAVPASAVACAGPQVVLDATTATIQAFVRAKGMEVLTFVGYSGAGYESPVELASQAASILDGKDPSRTLINSGATAEGIGAVYGLAKRKGFTTIGIVSSQARAQRVAFSPCADHVFVVNDATWGGRLPGQRELSPTSAAIVENSTAVVAIGGGEVARDEVLAAQQAGKLVVFIPADMNHAKAQRNARQAGKPAPRDFRGAVHQALMPADPPTPATAP